ncbi:uncharacterized protein LOC123402695 [Hordeum vulgare subsp. vulgare]|uniref:Uncharacterized protein n=1 Tax=Hordeum vulgare subsp. vulgare TaxID=112509 RepID=A0A8I6YEJ2_HORVV|nr:uncharacterized protein LOC123402695 [Hordeum vulgare subsp. vulgare]
MARGTPVPSKADQFAGEWWSKSSAKLPSQLFKQATMLEVTVVSAKELAIGEFRRRLLDCPAYAAVHADSSAARTGVSSEKGAYNGYRYWGEPVIVTVPAECAAIYLEIYCQKHDEPVAATRVPVGDFNALPPGELHCLSYRLFDTGPAAGSRNGVVNITVKRLDGA